VIERSKEYKNLLSQYGEDLFIVSEGRVFNSSLTDVGKGLEFLVTFGDVPEGVSVHLSNS
jgi:hypothetical protein